MGIIFKSGDGEMGCVVSGKKRRKENREMVTKRNGIAGYNQE